MKDGLLLLEQKLEPVEDLFFKWLLRVVVTATLVGSAWIDDAPPLDLAAMLLAIYLALRILMQSGKLFAAAPFDNRALKALVAVILLGVLSLSFITIEILVATLSAAVLQFS